MPELIKTRLGNIHLEHEPDGFYYSITTKDHFTIAGNKKPLSREDAIEEARITMDEYEEFPERFRD